jgi:predicted outer membrane repeat protein
MSDRNYSVTYGGAIAASTTKTFLTLSFNASTAGTGIHVEIVRYTTDGTGTAYTPLKYNAAAQARVSLFSAKVNYTVEPTTPTVVEQYEIPNTAGQFWQLPLGRELYLPPSTVTGIRVVTPAGASGNVAVNAVNAE